MYGKLSLAVAVVLFPNIGVAQERADAREKQADSRAAYVERITVQLEVGPLSVLKEFQPAVYEHFRTMMLGLDIAPDYDRWGNELANVTVTTSKPDGGTDIRMLTVDMGDYSLLYYLLPVREENGVRSQDGTLVGQEVVTILRFDEQSGELKPWDPILNQAAQDQGGDLDGTTEVTLDCEENGCGGRCCTATFDGGRSGMCTQCVCCGTPRRGCKMMVSLCDAL